MRCGNTETDCFHLAVMAAASYACRDVKFILLLKHRKWPVQIVLQELTVCKVFRCLFAINSNFAIAFGKPHASRRALTPTKSVKIVIGHYLSPFLAVVAVLRFSEYSVGFWASCLCSAPA